MIPRKTDFHPIPEGVGWNLFVAGKAPLPAPPLLKSNPRLRALTLTAIREKQDNRNINIDWVYMYNYSNVNLNTVL